MKRASLLIASGLAVSIVAGCGPMRDDLGAQSSIEVAIKRARDKVYPATVRIDARRTEFVGGSKRRIAGSGSGVIFDPDGHLLTNYHVAGRADEITVVLFNKERVRAEVVGGDPWTDLAVIRLDLDEVRRKDITFQHAAFGDSDAIEEGDGVLAIGSPFGLSRSISTGIISCRDRILASALELPGGLETGLFNTWLQTDAAINPGNSGGPLVNFQGEVVGINTRGGGNDLGFAVPINVAKEVVRQILESGKVSRSTMGVEFQAIQDLEAFFEVGKTEGAIVASVDPDGPAAAAGLQPQDVLIAYGDRAVSARYPEDLFHLRRRVSETPAGAKVPVTVKRGRSVIQTEIVVEELTTLRSEETDFPKWGLVGQGITLRLARRENLPSTEGVYVTGVRGGEPAANAHLKSGDVILRVGDQQVADLKALKKFYDQSVRKKEKQVLLRVRRGLAMVPVLLTVEYAPPPRKPPAEKPQPGKPPEPPTEPPEEEPPEEEPAPAEPPKEEPPKEEPPEEEPGEPAPAP